MILFELNVRLYRRTLSELAAEHLERLAALGFDWIWLMGLWRIGPRAIAISRTYGDDFEGSPYAIHDYEVSPELGGEPALRAFVERAHALGLRVMADFVPNHMSVDSPLIDAHPDYVIHWSPSFRDAHWSDYFDHPKGRLAHGKDPYFAGWTDTVQLDYTHVGLRAHQIETLRRLARIVDGVRCDMAMLVLRDQIKRQWFPRVDQALFDHHFPEEFWSEAIRTIKRDRPEFTFMAEVYWDKEPYLQHLGFDFTYDKKLHDLLAHAAPEAEIAGYLGGADPAYLRRSVHFLENHDEERARVRFGDRQRAAAILSFGVPGAVFVHQGEMEGVSEKLPVQRRIPREHAPVDPARQRFYAELLRCVRDPLLREGSLDILRAEGGLVLVLRRRAGRAALVGACPGHHPPEKSPAFTVPGALLGAAGAAGEGGLTFLDQLAGGTVTAARRGEDVVFAEGAVASFAEHRGFVLSPIGGESGR
ncbi:MAG: alpha-amylase family glycosyl hydrolase [Byssovorax sp.]